MKQPRTIPDYFTRGFLDAMYFMNNLSGSDISLDVIEENTWSRILESCKEFLANNFSDSEGQVLRKAKTLGMKAGWDFYMARNNAGVGFVDNGDWTREKAEQLQQAARDCGPFEITLAITRR